MLFGFLSCFRSLENRETTGFRVIGFVNPRENPKELPKGVKKNELNAEE